VSHALITEAKTPRAVLSLRALESRSAREQIKLLREMRGAVVQALADATGFRSFQLGQVLAEIDRYIAMGRAAAERAATAAATRAFGLGADAVDAALKSAGARVSIPQGLYGITSNLLSSVIDVTTDQTRAVWSELGRRLKMQVRQVALGITDPVQAMLVVAKRITDPKTFGTAMTRAETIIRTEVGRTFSISQQRRNVESNERLKVVGMTIYKYWQYTHDTRTREDHIQAGKDYSVSKAIPYDEPFLVGGEELMFPLDPKGSAEQTINCRCNSQSVVRKGVVEARMLLVA
jgi:hypothetical protein